MTESMSSEERIDELVEGIRSGEVSDPQWEAGKLVEFGEPAVEALAQLLSDPSEEVRCSAVEALIEFGELSVNVLGRAFLDDPDLEVRKTAFSALASSEEECEHILVHALEESSGYVVGRILGLIKSSTSERQIRPWDDPIDAKVWVEAILQELVVRDSGRPDSLFNPDSTSGALRSAFAQNPRLRRYTLNTLCSLAYDNEGGVRRRAVALARQLGAEEFASLVRMKADESPAAAESIMRQLGGSEAAAFFSDLQSQALERFRAPLVGLEETSQQRWNELTRQAHSSFYISMSMSVALFLVGVTIVIWGLILLTRSSELSQQIGGGVLSALAALATTFSGRFWKDPVEHIEKFSAQQARLQAAFIGYMNRVAQLRLVFEYDYAEKEITLEGLGAYQKMLSEAIDQASQQLEG